MSSEKEKLNESTSSYPTAPSIAPGEASRRAAHELAETVEQAEDTAGNPIPSQKDADNSPGSGI
ncbi:MAG: hypothetical protein NVS4B8_10730 [Herpetosiphon sp.]